MYKSCLHWLGINWLIFEFLVHSNGVKTNVFKQIRNYESVMIYKWQNHIWFLFIKLGLTFNIVLFLSWKAENQFSTPVMTQKASLDVLFILYCSVGVLMSQNALGWWRHLPIYKQTFMCTSMTSTTITGWWNTFMSHESPQQPNRFEDLFHFQIFKTIKTAGRQCRKGQLWFNVSWTNMLKILNSPEIKWHLMCIMSEIRFQHHDRFLQHHTAAQFCIFMLKKVQDISWESYVKQYRQFPLKAFRFTEVSSQSNSLTGQKYRTGSL